MNAPDNAPATRMTLTLPDERSARRLADVLTETFDASDAAVAAFETDDGSWNVAAYFGAAPDQSSIRAIVSLAAGAEAAQACAFSTVEARDWVRASLEGLTPVSAGRFLVHGAHDRARIPPNRIGIEIEAALAFGTGHHGTTRGCLILLDDVLKRTTASRVLDLGSGTGVLAIAAAKVLRRPVLASDIDPQAMAVAHGNAQLNRVGNLVHSIQAKGFAAAEFRAEGPFDIVLANILARPLVHLAPAMVKHLAPGAHVILSGLLPSHAAGVIAAYRAQGLVLLRKIECAGWTSLLLRASAPKPSAARHPQTQRTRLLDHALFAFLAGEPIHGSAVIRR